MAIYTESRTPKIPVRPPTGYAKLDKGFTAFASMYDLLGAKTAIKHIEAVSNIAFQCSIIEPEKFTSNGKPEINERLFHVLGLHLLRNSGLRYAKLPDVVRKYGTIRSGLDEFCTLRDMDLSKVPISAYAPVLDGLPEGLLVRLADVAQYHDPQWSAGMGEIAHPALFSSGLSPSEEQKRVARVARLLYAPLADFLGYRRLSGQTLDMAARILFNDTLGEVDADFSRYRKETENTQTLVLGMAKVIQEFCNREGIEVDIVMRKNKSRGKLVEKIRYRRSKGDHGFCFRQNHDTVAFKIVVKGLKGQQNVGEEKKIEAVYKIKNFMETEVYSMPISQLAGKPFRPLGKKSLSDLNVSMAWEDFFAKRKLNNYRAIHGDFSVPQDLPFVNFETQIVTEESDSWSRHGGAAHFAYNAQRYAGNGNVQAFTATWAQMMEALKTGREEVMVKYLIPSFRLIPVRVRLMEDEAGHSTERILDIPSNRLVADVLVRAGFDITEKEAHMVNKPDLRLDSTVGDNTYILVKAGGSAKLSDRFIHHLLGMCAEVQTALQLHKALKQQNGK